MTELKKLRAEVDTLLAERYEVFKLQREMLEKQDAQAQAQAKADAVRQTRGWAIDRAIETLKLTGVTDASAVVELSEQFVEYVEGVE